ncbi:hypothetical protein LC613_38840 [Nostoc sphaeroides CHAB 2801]|nr:hypothetical protein [Nostoc sphaeroides]MCC5633425.1 hypothetical protein [Nostoc sphaeroides CHAB 2801]
MLSILTQVAGYATLDVQHPQSYAIPGEGLRLRTRLLQLRHPITEK